MIPVASSGIEDHNTGNHMESTTIPLGQGRRQGSGLRGALAELERRGHEKGCKNEIYMYTYYTLDIYIYMYMYTHTYMYIHMCVYVYIYTNAYILYIYIHTYIHTYLRTYIHTCIHTYTSFIACIQIDTNITCFNDEEGARPQGLTQNGHAVLIISL